MTLAGLDPDTTPLPEWCAAAFALLVDATRDADDLERVLDKLSEPLPGEPRSDLDRETWGMSEAAQQAQARLLAGWGRVDQ